ncbi:MAG: hypothetical protein ACYDBB_17935 [Armatimonadota bacterium]
MKNTLLFACCSILLLTAGLLAQADHAFTLRDYTHHDWTNEMVTYQIDLPPADAQRSILLNPAGKQVPVQVVTLTGGKAWVSFIVEGLPADGEVTYILKTGKSAGTSLVGKENKGTVTLDAGIVAVKVPAPGARTFANPVPLKSVMPPLLAVRGVSGAWLGTGRLLGDLPVKTMKSSVIATGPVYAESRTEYTFANGAYAMTVRVVRGQEAVTVREEFDTPKEAVGKTFFSFLVSAGLNPDRVATEIRSWRKRTDVKTNALSSDYKLDFDENRKEISILGYVNWWPETARRATFYKDGVINGDALSILPAHVGWWRNPMGMYVMTTKEKQVSLDLPLYIDQDWVRDGVEWNNPYYTGKLEAGWPRTAGRRAWVLHCTTLGEALPKEGRSTVLEGIRKYCDLPLDKVKDWVLEWKADPKITYPRLYVEPGKIDDIRTRVKGNPRWMGRFGQYMNRPISYTILEDQKVGAELLRAKSSPDWNTPNEAQGSLESLRSLVDKFWANGYMGFAAPNNAAPMGELIKFDAAMSVATVTPEEKAEMRRLMAFVANVVYDEDWHAIKSGVHLGNPNMPPRQEHHLGVAGCVLPDHPLATIWRKRGETEALRELDDMVREEGTWRECPHYQFEAAMYPMFQSAVPIYYNGGQNIFANPKLKATWDYLANISTPPDPRFGTRLVPAFGNGSWEMAPQFGWLANLTKKDDPAFSKRMQWMWQEQGKPDWMKFSETILDPSLPAEQPNMVSKNYPGFGAILRNGFPAKDESWVAFRAGENVEHYNHGDQNSFMYYAKGAPLVIQFGSQYTPYFRGAWYFNRVSIGHQPVKDNMFGGTEFAGAAGNADYAAKMIEFHALGGADLAVSRHDSNRQSLLPDDKNVAMPPNFPSDPYEIPRHVWTRQMMLVKSFTPDGKPDTTGPGYLVMRDNIQSDNPLPSEWNVWMLVDKIDTTANPVRCQSPFGVQLDVFMAEPAQPKWTTREDTNKFLAGPSVEYWQKTNPGKPWVETLKNLRGHAAPGGGFLAVLYPRKNDEPAAQFTTLLNGKGVAIAHPRGKDVVFLGLQPVLWSEGDRSFTGTAGVIRQEGETLSLILQAGGEISANGIKMKAAGPASLTITGHSATLLTDGPAQTVEVTFPAGTLLKVNGQPAPRSGTASLVANVAAGTQKTSLMW